MTRVKLEKPLHLRIKSKLYSHRHNTTLRRNKKEAPPFIRSMRGNPTSLLRNYQNWEVKNRRRSTIRSLRHPRVDMSVWGSTPSTLTRMTPVLRHEILSTHTQDMLFRDTTIIQQMMEGRPRSFTFFNNPVKFILVIAHGYIVHTMACPKNMAILHVTESDIRGHALEGDKVPPLLDTILGRGGNNFAAFMNSKIHGSALSPDAATVAYSTFGPDRMPEFHLWKTGDATRDALDTITGVYDITHSIQNSKLEASNFDYKSPSPLVKYPGRYTEIPHLTELLKQRKRRYQYSPTGGVYELGTPLSILCKQLQTPVPGYTTRYDNKLCFMIVLCCSEPDPRLSNAAGRALLSAAGPAYTSFPPPSIR